MMNREDIIAMAQEALITHSNENPFDFRFTSVDQLECFARLVAQAEREACIKACEDEIVRVRPIYSVTAENCVKAIRERGRTHD